MNGNALCHIVLYSFKSKAELGKGVQTMLNLKNKCLKDGKPYVLNVHAGTTQPHPPIRTLGEYQAGPSAVDNFAHARNAGFNLACIMYFKNDEDRKYFVTQDPAHSDLKSFTTPRIKKELLVLDFISGQSNPGYSAEDC